jgi:hypothetical protein
MTLRDAMVLKFPLPSLQRTDPQKEIEAQSALFPPIVNFDSYLPRTDFEGSSNKESSKRKGSRKAALSKN